MLIGTTPVMKAAPLGTVGAMGSGCVAEAIASKACLLTGKPSFGAGTVGPGELGGRLVAPEQRINTAFPPHTWEIIAIQESRVVAFARLSSTCMHIGSASLQNAFFGERPNRCCITPKYSVRQE